LQFTVIGLAWIKLESGTYSTPHSNSFTAQIKVRFAGNIPNYLLKIPRSLEQTRSMLYLNHSGNINDTRRTALFRTCTYRSAYKVCSIFDYSKLFLILGFEFVVVLYISPIVLFITAACEFNLVNAFNLPTYFDLTVIEFYNLQQLRGDFQGSNIADISQPWVWSEATPGRFEHPSRSYWCTTWLVHH